MEIRLRSAVSRTAKGYSIEATLDMGELVEIIAGSGSSPHDILHNAVDDLSAFQIAKLKEHMEKLGAAFPRGEA